jgi:hypothetical protein
MRPLSPVRLVFIAVLSCAATTAHAQQWARHHPNECQPMYPHEGDNFAIIGAGAANSATNTTITLVCPSDDTDQYPDSVVTEVRVYVYDASPTDFIRVRACIMSRDDEFTHSSCSGSIHGTTTTFVGPAVITLSGDELADWRQGQDFGFIRVELPAKSGPLNFSYIKGWVTNH